MSLWKEKEKVIKMREILFRGKSINGGWIYGNLVEDILDGGSKYIGEFICAEVMQNDRQRKPR